MNINKSKAILITLVVLISLLLVQAAFAADATTNSDSLDVMASVDESIPLTSDVSSVDEVISSSQNDANLKVQDVTNNSLATISNENILKGGDDNKIYVSTTGKDDSGDGSSSNPYATIKQALNAVTEDKNTIYVNDGIYKFSESTTISKSLINKVVTIEGQSNNVILDGQGSSYIFYIMSPTTLKNLKFTNGYSNTKGSVINIYGTSAEICNCIFVNNTVKTQSTSYGTIYSGNGYKDDIYLNIYNSTFNNNTVTTTAYYQTIYGAAVAYDLSYGKLNIENTTFKIVI